MDKMDLEIKGYTANYSDCIYADATPLADNITGTKYSSANNQDMNFCECSSLLSAAAKGDRESLQKLLKQGSARCCLLQDEKGLTPIHKAAQMGNVGVLKLLFGACKEAATKRTNDGETAAHLAVRSHCYEALKFLIESMDGDVDFLNAKNNLGNTVLHLAVGRKQLQTVKFLLGRPGIIVNAQNGRNNRPLDRLYDRQDSLELALQMMLQREGAIAELVQPQTQISKPTALINVNVDQDDYFNILSAVLNLLGSTYTAAAGPFLVFNLMTLFTSSIILLLHIIFGLEQKPFMNLLLRYLMGISLLFAGLACYDCLLQKISQEYHVYQLFFIVTVLIVLAFCFVWQALIPWCLRNKRDNNRIRTIKFAVLGIGVFPIIAATFLCFRFSLIWFSSTNNSTETIQANPMETGANIPSYCSNSSTIQNSEIGIYVRQCLERNKKASVSSPSDLELIRHCLVTGAAKHLLYSDEEMISKLQLPESNFIEEVNDLWLLAIAYYLTVRTFTEPQHLPPT